MVDRGSALDVAGAANDKTVSKSVAKAQHGSWGKAALDISGQLVQRATGQRCMSQKIGISGQGVKRGGQIPRFGLQ